MEIISDFFSHFIQPDPKTALLVVLNLILIESLLSVDNAAVLATMVMDLPAKQRKRALRIGLFFAYPHFAIAGISEREEKYRGKLNQLLGFEFAVEVEFYIGIIFSLHFKEPVGGCEINDVTIFILHNRS